MAATLVNHLTLRRDSSLEGLKNQIFFSIFRKNLFLLASIEVK